MTVRAKRGQSTRLPKGQESLRMGLGWEDDSRGEGTLKLSSAFKVANERREVEVYDSERVCQADL